MRFILIAAMLFLLAGCAGTPAQDKAALDVLGRLASGALGVPYIGADACVPPKIPAKMLKECVDPVIPPGSTPTDVSVILTRAYDKCSRQQELLAELTKYRDLVCAPVTTVTTTVRQ